MKTHALVLLAMPLLACLAPLSAEELPTIQPSRAVGSVFGNPITAADIGLTAPIDTSFKYDARDTERWELMGRVTKAFGKPISDRFVKKRKIDATEEEIAEFKKTSRENRQKHLRETESRSEKVKAELSSPNLSSEIKSKLEEERAMLDRLLPRLRDSATTGAPDALARMFIVARKTERELHRIYGGRMIFQQAGAEALDARRLLFEEAEKNGDLKFDDEGVRHVFYYYFSNMKHVVIDENILEKRHNERTPHPPNVRIQPKTPQAEKKWIISESTVEPMELAPKQIVPVESGVWFGGRQPGSDSAPIGFMDLDAGHVTLLIENGSSNWDAVGTEAIAVQLDRKSLVRLSAADQSVATRENSPEECKYFSQVEAYEKRFCISSPYNPLWVFDPWLNRWQKIELKSVTDSDSARLGPSYYRPSMDRFVIGPRGDFWGFQGTHDATRGNAVCCYVPRQAKWKHYGFPWATACGDDHWPLGETDTVVMFAGQKDLLFFDKESHRWSTSQLIWPAGSYGSAKFTPHGVLISAGNTVKRLTPDLSAWESVATLDNDERITAIATTEASLYLATTSGIHVLDKIDADHFEEPKFYPWKFVDQTKTYKAVFGLASQDRVLSLANKLCKASTEGDLELVRTLLSEGADTETTTDPQGSTPLLLACFQGHIRVAELLIENGANIHAKNSFRQNGLILAARGGHRELADYLMSKGVKR